jgi:hypothetical protein
VTDWWNPTSTLSKTDSEANRRMFWNVRAMPARLMRNGGRPAIERPAMRTSPAAGR